MFSRFNFAYLYTSFCKLYNHPLVKKYLGFKSFEIYFDKNSNFYELSIFQKLRLILLPDLLSEKYSLFNDKSLFLLNFRKKLFFSQNFHKYSFDFNYSIIDSIIFLTRFFKFFKKYDTMFVGFKNIFKTNNSYLNFYFFFYFFKKNFSNIFSSMFFLENRNSNLIKIFFIVKKILSNSNFFKLPNYDEQDIRKISNWYTFLNDKNNYVSNLEISEKIRKEIELKKFNILKIEDNFIKSYIKLYSIISKSIFDSNVFSKLHLSDVKIDLNQFWLVIFKKNFFEKFTNILPYRYADSSINKHINLSKIDNFIFFFLRKNKIFNKGRYSRNRQTYRTGFYWCLWLNIFVVYGLHFVFYRFIFTFGYVWLFLFLIFGSFIFSRALKYNFISLNYIINELSSFKNFFLNLFNINIFKNSLKTVQLCIYSHVCEKNFFSIFDNFFKNLLILDKKFFSLIHIFYNDYTQVGKVSLTYYDFYLGHVDLKPREFFFYNEPSFSLWTTDIHRSTKIIEQFVSKIRQKKIDEFKKKYLKKN